MRSGKTRKTSAPRPPSSAMAMPNHADRAVAHFGQFRATPARPVLARVPCDSGAATGSMTMGSSDAGIERFLGIAFRDISGRADVLDCVDIPDCVDILDCAGGASGGSRRLVAQRCVARIMVGQG